MAPAELNKDSSDAIRSDFNNLACAGEDPVTDARFNQVPSAEIQLVVLKYRTVCFVRKILNDSV